jgi:phospholipase/carboxylesterase
LGTSVLHADTLEAVEIETGPFPTGAIVWLHGVGADGHHFAPLVPQLARTVAAPLRFVFPHAPYRRITLCNGERMRGWYDLRNVDRQLEQDDEAIRGSFAAISALLHRERERGIAPGRLVLGGFSQGGAMSLFTGPRFPERLAGIVVLSGYRLIAQRFDAERQAANQHTPIFMGYGTRDPVVDVREGETSREMLRSAGYPVEWHTYPVGHEVSPEAVADVADFLARVL